jgi:hypothetical protein
VPAEEVTEQLDSVLGVFLDEKVTIEDEIFLSLTQEFVCSASIKKKARLEVNLKTVEPEERLRFKQAMVKELTSWKKYGAVKGVARAGISPQDFLRFRWVLTRKADGSAKARLVLLGYQDRDLEKLVSCSPTASRRARSLFLLTAAKKKWSLAKADVSSAFLQGYGTEEARKIYLDPDDQLREFFGLGQDEVLQLVKPAYGSIHAPREWWKTIKKDFQPTPLYALEIEPCLWTLYDGTPKVAKDNLIGQVIVHVDDFVFAGDWNHPLWKNVVHDIRQLYDWGQWETGNITQCGVKIEQTEDGFRREGAGGEHQGEV